MLWKRGVGRKAILELTVNSLQSSINSRMKHNVQDFFKRVCYRAWITNKQQTKIKKQTEQQFSLSDKKHIAKSSSSLTIPVHTCILKEQMREVLLMVHYISIKKFVNCFFFESLVFWRCTMIQLAVGRHFFSFEYWLEIYCQFKKFQPPWIGNIGYIKRGLVMQYLPSTLNKDVANISSAIEKALHSS